MTDRDVRKAVASICRSFDTVAVATYDGGASLLVVLRSDITPRARRAAVVRDAMGRHGRRLGLAVYTPQEVLELRRDPGSPLGGMLASCEVVHGSLEGLRRWPSKGLPNQALYDWGRSPPRFKWSMRKPFRPRRRGSAHS